jgi:hypothetical protein
MRVKMGCSDACRIPIVGEAYFASPLVVGAVFFGRITPPDESSRHRCARRQLGVRIMSLFGNRVVDGAVRSVRRGSGVKPDVFIPDDASQPSDLASPHVDNQR